MHISYLQGNITCYNVSNTSRTEWSCGNTGIKKVPTYLCNGNENSDGRTNYPYQVSTGNHRRGNRWSNGIQSPNQIQPQRNLRKMEKIICKWDWQLSTRCWCMCYWNWHNILHQKWGYDRGPKGDLWPQCGGLSPTKGRPILHMYHSGR